MIFTKNWLYQITNHRHLYRFQSSCKYSRVMTDQLAEKLREKIEGQYFGANSQEQGEMADLPSLLGRVECFVDVGASFGQYAYHANKILKQARIVCFEADATRFTRLRELTEQWQSISTNTIESVHAAVSDTVGVATFYMTDESLCGGLHRYWELQGVRTRGPVTARPVEVKSVTLDSAFLAIPPDLVKIDVEGAEYRVLVGATELLKQRKTRFLVEIHPWGDPTIGKASSDIFKLFYANNYNFRRFHTHWYFYPDSNARLSWLKFQIVQFSLDSLFLRRVGKSLYRGAQSLKSALRRNHR